MKMPMLPQGKTGRLAAGGIFLALALLLSYLENLFALFIPWLPGLKIGLANVLITFLFFFVSEWEAAAVSFCRVLIMGLLFGSAISFLYSLGGAVLAFAGLFIAKKLGERISFLGTSVICACLHNIGQMTVAAGFFGVGVLNFYLPYLLLGGVFFGALTGLLLNFTAAKYKKVIDK